MTLSTHSSLRVRASKRRLPRATAGLVLLILPGIMLIVSAILKFAGIHGVVQQMAAAGFSGPKLIFLASLEIACAALFLWPRTRSLGLLLVSAYLGGAICTHIQVDQYVHALPPSLLLALAWVGTWLQHPQTLWISTPK